MAKAMIQMCLHSRLLQIARIVGIATPYSPASCLAGRSDARISLTCFSFRIALPLEAPVRLEPRRMIAWSLFWRGVHQCRFVRRLSSRLPLRWLHCHLGSGAPRKAVRTTR